MGTLFLNSIIYKFTKRYGILCVCYRKTRIMICITVPKLLRHFSGCALWPFILIKQKDLKSNKVFINHERIHLRQQLELLILPFYIWYMLEYAYYRTKGYSKQKAYRSIVFEREAYKFEADFTYLEKRRFWGFLKS